MEHIDHSRCAIDTLPPEILCRVIDFLDAPSVCAARAAHRCFRVHTVQHVHRAVRDPAWLRMPIARVCQTGRVDILDFLYARKRIPLTLNMLTIAVEGGHLDVVRLVYRRDQRHTECALTHAAKAGRLDMVQFLCEHRQDGVDCGEALTYAVEGGHLDVAEFLLTHGRVHDASRGISSAIARGHYDIARAIIESRPHEAFRWQWPSHAPRPCPNIGPPVGRLFGRSATRGDRN
ncbi:Ankyrin repeat domain containing protein [Pandoravirus salinus]|uniref:Ankyrin repeat domain containing protein n=1 Tax=Pandoravirus salinus TaxID=1349410 RepID=S4W049_9VIRU|nr:ankyrin repeat domain [Pandoravirus salinus]AGO85161.1 Ankyrin repeat domain containing protein [Pandoravirus salinus]